jgi:arsenite methyltransferase
MPTPFAPSEQHQRSLRKYKRKAAHYDSTIGPTNRIRAQTIARLGLKSGSVVLDAGCGSGASIALLLEQVGSAGKVFAFDQSPDMLAIARKKFAHFHTDQLELKQGFAESVQISLPVDAILFHYTHDIFQSPEAVANLLAQAKPGAAISIAGLKHFPWWTGPLCLLSYCKNYGWNGNHRGLWRPWKNIAPALDNFTLESTQWGMGYMAYGNLKPGYARQ